MKAFRGISLLLVFSLICFGQQQEKIRESVSVINVEVPIRVLLKGQPVGGLTKADFELFIGKQKVPIHGFNEVRRKIIKESPGGMKEDIEKPRLFLLIFNIADYTFELQEGLDHLFSKVIQKGDRLIVFSNNYYLRDHTITDLDIEKKRIEQAIKFESKKILREIRQLESRLSTLVNDTRSQLNRMKTGTDPLKNVPLFTGNPEFLCSYLRQFYYSYLTYYEEFSRLFFDFETDEYVNLAEYLKNIDIEKWGFNFYQIGGFPKLRINGWLSEVIRRNYDYFEAGTADGDSQTWGQTLISIYNESMERMDVYDSSYAIDLSKIFLNTQISFNTLLMKFTFQRNSLPMDFKYESMTVHSENLLRELTKATGGLTLHSNDYGDFINRVSTMEDIIYVLTYDKSLVERITDEKIRIKLLGKDNHYRVIYDTQQRPQYLRKKVNTLESYPAIKIGNLRIEDKVLYFDLDNINIPPVKEFGNGKFELRVKLLDSRANEVVNQKSQIEAFQNSEEIKINLSKIAPGSYDVILEVDDLITKTNDFVMIGIKILSENIILGQNIEYDSTEFEKKLLEKKTKVQMNQDISIQRKPVKLQSSKVKGSKTIRGQSIASYAEPLKKALVKTSEYCSLLQEMSLYFFCREKVVESVNLDYLRELKPVTEMKQPEENIYISNNTGNISSTDYARPARWGSDFMGKSIANRNIVNLNYLYDYQLFQNEGKIEERRELLRENGERVNIMNAPLKTRFKYHNIIFGPMVFGEKQHQFYKYEIIKKTRKKRRNILIVEATPVDPEAAQMLTGRLWIDEKDHSIIRVEATHRSIENYEYIELYARKNMLIPEIKIVQEYNIEKNGVRFPSSATIEEAYITPQKKKIVLSSIKVKYSDYKFFTVGTKVTEEKIKK